MGQLGAAAVCIVIAGVVLAGFLKGLPVFDLFIEGAKSGFHTALRLIPTLIGLVCGVTMLRASGALDWFACLLEPICKHLHINTDLLPLMILRPLSGSGAMSYVTELFSRYGADAEVSRMAAVLSSATETTFYAVAVYFGGRGYKSTCYAVPAALCGDVMAVVLSVLSVRIFG